VRFWIQIPYPNSYLLIDALKWEISILYHGSILFVILVNQHVIQSELYVGILCLITLMIHVLFWTLANYLPMPHSFLESSFQTRVQAKTKFWKWHRWSFRTADCFFFIIIELIGEDGRLLFFLEQIGEDSRLLITLLTELSSLQSVRGNKDCCLIGIW